MTNFKAGEGNRTLVFSLEGCGSTIELRPPDLPSHRALCQQAAPTSPAARHPIPTDRILARCDRTIDGWWWGLDLNQRRLSQRIYSPSPLTTRASLHDTDGPHRTAERGLVFPPVLVNGQSADNRLFLLCIPSILLAILPGYPGTLLSG